jgi:exopolyphosphatase/pppGpp-phosphohydrolase
MNVDAARNYALEFLKINTGTQFHYHNQSHTIDVFDSVTYIAEAEMVDKKEIVLLQTAALYHDLGILIKYDTHEEESIKIVQLVLPGFGYSNDDINAICSFITDTRLQNTPKTELGKLLRDADLDYLGRDDYFTVSEQLKMEWETLGIKNYTFNEWYEFQHRFMSQHSYYSRSASMARDDGKVLNIKKISDLLKKV